MRGEQICYVDESIQDSLGVVVTAFVFAENCLNELVRDALEESGLDPDREEYKSSARMDRDKRMRQARDRLISIADRNTKIAVFFGPFLRRDLGRQSLQALQSAVVRNGLSTSSLDVHFDEGIFSSAREAERLRTLFLSLSSCTFHAEEDSKKCRGIQIADAVAGSFGQIVKAALTGTEKTVDVGGPNTGYEDGTEASLSWALLMNLRYGMLTRPVAHPGHSYDPATDPVVLDLENDDPVEFGQNPVLLGWGVLVAPEAESELREAVERRFGRLWLGCIH